MKKMICLLVMLGIFTAVNLLLVPYKSKQQVKQHKQPKAIVLQQPSVREEGNALVTPSVGPYRTSTFAEQLHIPLIDNYFEVYNTNVSISKQHTHSQSINTGMLQLGHYTSKSIVPQQMQHGSGASHNGVFTYQGSVHPIHTITPSTQATKEHTARPVGLIAVSNMPTTLTYGHFVSADDFLAGTRTKRGSTGPPLILPGTGNDDNSINSGNKFGAPLADGLWILLLLAGMYTMKISRFKFKCKL